MDNDALFVTPPPNLSASQFAISMGAREIALILGHSRHLVDPKTGLPTHQVMEWHASYAMSPTTAKQLHQALSDVLEAYVGQFGKIPEDPKGVVRFNNEIVVT